jgi:hypothetical protein
MPESFALRYSILFFLTYLKRLCAPLAAISAQDVEVVVGIVSYTLRRNGHASYSCPVSLHP